MLYVLKEKVYHSSRYQNMYRINMFDKVSSWGKNINVMFPCIFFWPFFWLYWIGAVKTDRKDDGKREGKIIIIFTIIFIKSKWSATPAVTSKMMLKFHIKQYEMTFEFMDQKNVQKKGTLKPFKKQKSSCWQHLLSLH